MSLELTTIYGSLFIFLLAILSDCFRKLPLVQESSRPSNFNLKEALLLGLIFAVAFYARIWHLVEFPYFLHNDEMNCGLEARKFLSDTPPPIIGTAWLGHPNLGFYLTSRFMLMFGDTLFGLRTSSVFFGLLSLGAVYLITRRALGVYAALLGMALTTSFHFHLHFSRMGIHNMQAASLSLLGLAFFYLGLIHGKLMLSVLSGFLLAVALQTYSSAFMNPVLIAIFVTYLSIKERNYYPPIHATACFLSILVLGYPMLNYWIQHPEAFNVRGSQMAIWKEQNLSHMHSVFNWTNYWELVWYQIKNGFGFIFQGNDTSVQYRFRGTLLDIFTLIPMTLGLTYSLFKIRHNSGILLLVLIVIATEFFGGVLLIDPPYSPRYVILAPIVLNFASYFWTSLYQIVGTRTKSALAPLILICLFGSAYINLNYYFVNYRDHHAGSPRDLWVRILSDNTEIKSIVSLFPTEEELQYEAFNFIAPNIKKVWLGSETQDITMIRSMLSPADLPAIVVLPAANCPNNNPNCKCEALEYKNNATCWYKIF